MKTSNIQMFSFHCYGFLRMKNIFFNMVYRTFRYTIGMFRKGYQKVLDVDDLYNPINSDRSTYLGDRLERLVFCIILHTYFCFRLNLKNIFIYFNIFNT